LHELAADELDFVSGGEQATNLMNPCVQTALSAAQWYLWRYSADLRQVSRMPLGGFSKVRVPGLGGGRKSGNKKGRIRAPFVLQPRPLSSAPAAYSE